jgi:hypothetical protein
MSTLRVDYERAAPPGAALDPGDDFVEFWHAGAAVRGLFSCVACGRSVVSARVLPPCPSCDGRLWEDAGTSPFGNATEANVTVFEDWSPADAEDRARLLRGVALALVVGPACWLMLAGLAFLFYALAQA